jgi:hypothetical protein
VPVPRTRGKVLVKWITVSLHRLNAPLWHQAHWSWRREIRWVGGAIGVLIAGSATTACGSKHAYVQYSILSPKAPVSYSTTTTAENKRFPPESINSKGVPILHAGGAASYAFMRAPHHLDGQGRTNHRYPCAGYTGAERDIPRGSYRFASYCRKACSAS